MEILTSPLLIGIHTRQIDLLSKFFLDFLDKNHLEQKIDFSTAASGILDLLFVSSNIQVLNLEPASFNDNLCKMSNHFPILATIAARVPTWYRSNPTRQSIFSFCRGNYTELNELLIERISQPIAGRVPTVSWTTGTSGFKTVLRQTVPIRTLHQAKLPPWVSHKTSHYIKCLKTARETLPRDTSQSAEYQSWAIKSYWNGQNCVWRGPCSWMIHFRTFQIF